MRSVVLAAMLALSLAPLAAAHGGAVVASGRNAAYSFSLQAADVRSSDGAPAVDLTAYPIKRANGAPDLDAEVEVRIDGGESLRLRRVSDGYELVVPVAEPGAWREWQIAAVVTGDGGRLTIRSEPDRKRDAGAPIPLIAFTAIVALIAVVAVIARRRRLSRAGDAGRTGAADLGA